MSPFTLAALASAAVEDLSFVRTNLFTTGQVGDYDTAKLVADNGDEYLVRIPTNERAFAELEADLRGINAMSAGIRSRLRFVIPRATGHVDHDPFSGLVLTFARGEPLSISSIGDGTGHADSLGMTIASIHNLPTDFVDDYGLPNSNAGAVRDAVTNVVDRAGYDGKVQLPLITRWSQAIADDQMWDFDSTVIHGDLSEEAVLFTHATVSGIIGWHDLAIGDPAQDLGWAVSSMTHSATLMSAYTTRRAGEADRFIADRARLHGELALAKWLLFGIEQDDDAIVADARNLLEDLANKVESNLVPKLSSAVVPSSPVLLDMHAEQAVGESAGDQGVTGQVSGLITESISPEALLAEGQGTASAVTEAVTDVVVEPQSGVNGDIIAYVDEVVPAEIDDYSSDVDGGEEVVDVEAVEEMLELPTDALENFDIEPVSRTVTEQSQPESEK